MLMEELSPKMTLEVASGLFELYLTLADIQSFWSSIPGRWVPCPSLSPFLHAPICLCPLRVSQACTHPSLSPCPSCPPASSRRSLGQDPEGPLKEGSWDVQAEGV